MKRKSPKNYRRKQRAIRKAEPTTGMWVASDVMPVFTFSNDSDTGFYVEGSGDITFVTGGSSATTITTKA